jgi:hypothetical protein
MYLCKNFRENISDLHLHVKNKACTFALPIGNNGSENDRDHEFGRGRATFFDMMKRAKR